MATYSNAPGISEVGVVSTPFVSETGSNSFTVPANSYAMISIYCEKTANNSFDNVLSQSVVAGGNTIHAAKTVNITTDNNANTVAVVVSRVKINTLEIFTSTNNISVHYVVFS
tara:strand:- start:904 stop:1242 length:339 start_codon:yes stop_codon:yes gene_type:complete